jgi:uncharacterized membrane protein
MEVLIVLSRWLHVVAAVLAIGGLFFMRVILPLGLAQADAASRDAVFLRCRRAYKMTVHPCILILLLTGTFNTIRAWPDYALNKKLMHAFWGPHVILGLVAIVLSLVLLAPKQPPRWHKKGAAINLGLLLLVVALASTVKYVRDTELRNRANLNSPPPLTLPAVTQR